MLTFELNHCIMKYSKIFVSAPWEISLREDDFEDIINDPNEIIVKNMYSHLSAGTEMACVSGIEEWFKIPGVPGYTAVGKIIEKGTAVDHVNIGDIVFTYGPHQGIFKVNVTDRWHGVCVRVPEDLDPDIAAFTHMGGIAMASLRASEIQLGDNVLVSGLGAIGNLAAQFAQLQGANVLAVDINQSRTDMAKRSGIKHVLNTKDADLDDAVNDFTGGKKVDTWIDASGSSLLIKQAMDLIRGNGEMILLGTPRAPLITDITPLLRKIHLEGIKFRGALEFLFPTHNNDFQKHSIERNSRIIMDLMKDGLIKIKPFYSHKLPPSDASSAYLGLRDRPEEYVGVVFDWTI